MRTPKTVFVVGAGASCEVGLPSGLGLAAIIADKLNYRIVQGRLKEGVGDQEIIDLFQSTLSTRREIQKAVSAAQRVGKGIVFSKSIDSFLDAHRDDLEIQRCGKLAIVKTILEQEKKSALCIENGDFKDVETVRESWFVSLARNLFDGVRKNEVNRVFEKVAFVVFNYDRCLEHFLFQAVSNHYGLEADQTAHILSSLEIVHPYGSIAHLEWQNKREGIPFGCAPTRDGLEMMAQRIKTYTEQVAEENELSAIREQIRTADTLVFLGSSFHPENIKILDPRRPTMIERVFATAYKISQSDISDIDETVRTLIKNDIAEDRFTAPIHIRGDARCVDLMQEYSRSLFVAGRGGDR